MKRSKSTFTFYCAIAFFTASLAVAESPKVELFSVVDDELRDKALAYNERFVARVSYFAEKIWVVTLNSEALTEHRTSLLNIPGIGDGIYLNRSELIWKRHSSAFYWTGNVVVPESEWPKEALEKLERAGETFESFIGSFGETWIPANEWFVDALGTANTTATALAIGEPPNSGGASAATSTAERPDLTDDLFFSVNTEFNLVVAGKGRYMLSPLPNSPRYHVLVQIDTDKYFGILDEKLTPEIAARQEAYNQFQATLPAKIEKQVKGSL